MFGRPHDAITARIEADQKQGLIPELDASLMAITLNRLDVYTLLRAFGQAPMAMLSVRRSSAIAVAAVFVLLWLTPLAFASSIVIGVPNWPSAQVKAHIIDQLFREKLEAKTELKRLGSLNILSGINQGVVHLHPEIWLPNLAAPVRRFSEDRGTLKLSPNASAGRQQICTTRETAERTGIKKLSDLADPAMAGNFDTNSDGLGEMWIGAPTWSSSNVERVRARSYGYDQTMTLVEIEEDVAMAGVDVAVALGRPIVFYCYSPHHVFQLHELVILEEQDHDPTTWNIIPPNEDKEWLKNSRAGSAWAASSYQIGFASKMEEQNPKAARLMEYINFSESDSIAMSYQAQVDGSPPADVARSWIANNQSRILSWLDRLD